MVRERLSGIRDRITAGVQDAFEDARERLQKVRQARRGETGDQLVVAGIDVGESNVNRRRKAFHAVGLKGGSVVGKAQSDDPAKIAEWCRSIGADFVGVDAPSRWNNGPGSRPAERDMRSEGINAFPTPTREKAASHRTGFYNWMLNGERLYEQLQSTHPLYDGTSQPTSPACFETFPHAVACALSGNVVSGDARDKEKLRRDLLTQDGIDTGSLEGLDWVDAALCALTARYFAMNSIRTYGESATGLIVVPSSPGGRHKS